MLEGSILQKLTVAHQKDQSVKHSQNFGVYYKNTLVALCHALEDCILTSSSAPLVIAAFQRGKWYLQEAERYSDLAAKSRQIVIMAASDTGFAEHSTSQRPNVELVELNSDDPVAQEWHLIILSPTYTAIVLCQELSAADYGPAGPPTEDLERKFYGFWTFEAGLVQEAVDLAIAHIDQYNSELQEKLKTCVQAIAEESQTTPPDELDQVVSQVVNYLQTSQQELGSSSSHASLDKNLVSNELQAFLRMAQLTDLADAENPRAAAEVAVLAEMIGQLLDLPARQIQRLRLASYLHRIGPLSEAQSVFNAAYQDSQEDEAPDHQLTCPLVPGAQVLRMMPRLRKVAQIITHQAEWWDGSGQPANLAGDQIPLESRILGLVADFQQRVTQLQATSTAENSESLDAAEQDELAQALAACQSQKGKRWDPELVDILALLVSGMQQGMSLPTKPPKLTASMWLLETQKDDRARTSYVREEVYGY